MAVPLPQDPVIVTGIGGILDTNSTRPVAPRLEIRDLMLNKPMWYLFLKGLQSFQREDANVPRSYYGISGIHGLPFVPYNEVVGRKLGSREVGNVGGYCAHTSVVFTTWHRPYLALFEQELYRHVQKEAANITDDSTGAYQKAARDFRLPYWDWARPRSSTVEAWPRIFDAATIKTDRGIIDPNPLATFDTRPLPRPIPGGSVIGTRTRRRPSSDLADSFFQGNPERTENVNQLMFTENGWVAFSDDRYRQSQALSRFGGIEGVHNGIHGEIGGHMGAITTSAFDPIFWLHHCNIDRLTAIWQCIYPRAYLDKTGHEVGSIGTNFISSEGDLQNIDTPLKPFWSRKPTANDAVDLTQYNKVFWNSGQIRFTETLGYTYPETNDRLRVGDPDQFKAIVEQAALRAYPGPLRPRRTRPSAAPARIVPAIAVQQQAKAVPAPPAPTAVSAMAAPVAAVAAMSVSASTAAAAPVEKDPSTLIGADNSYTDWTFNVRAVKHILGRPYQVVVFDGDFNPDPARWLTEYNKVGIVAILGQGEDTGCAKCREDQHNEQSVTGAVGLTSALVQDFVAGRLASLRPDDVVPYLTRHLHWRVVFDGVEDVPREQVPGLTVNVSSTKVTFDENGVPRFSPDHVLHPSITDNRAAGLAVGQTP